MGLFCEERLFLFALFGAVLGLSKYYGIMQLVTKNWFKGIRSKQRLGKPHEAPFSVFSPVGDSDQILNQPLLVHDYFVKLLPTYAVENAVGVVKAKVRRKLVYVSPEEFRNGSWFENAILCPNKLVVDGDANNFATENIVVDHFRYCLAKTQS